MEPLQPVDPLHIGGYRLTARLGAGGMGRVYLARTPSGRGLVIKVIRPEFAREAGFRARFAREAEAARRVGGFHTAQVVDADPDADTPWIATAHIPGPTLGAAVRDHGPIAPPALHVLAAGLAEGLRAIHACGLVHRDLKPDNVILAEDGPRIIDFGIARPLDADSVTTQGAVFGTLPYMSPEQAEGSRVGPASDVFSLGTVLAYAATGTNPYNGASMAETVRRLIGPPPDPGGIDPGMRDLIAACWDHAPERRPTPDTILARFADLDLRGAWPPGRTGPATGTAPAPPLPTAAPPATAQAAPTAGDGTPPPPPTRDAPSGEDRPRRRPRGRTVGIAAAAVLTAFAVVAAVAVVRSLPWPRATLNGHDGPVTSVAYSPDGALLATGGDDRSVRLWDTATGDQADVLSGGSPVNAVAFSPDGTLLATGGEDGVARLWNVDTRREIGALSLDGPPEDGEDIEVPRPDVFTLAFSPDQTTLATGDGYGTVHLWDVGSGERAATITGHDSYVHSVAFSPDGTLVASGSQDGTARLWDVSGEDPTAAPSVGHLSWIHDVAFSPDGSLLATSGWDGTARLWDTTDAQEAATLAAEDRGYVSSVAFHPDGDLLAGGASDGSVRLWDPATGEQADAFAAHADVLRSLAFSPDGATLATAGDDGSARLWSVD